MHIGGIGPVAEQRLISVNGLQQQEIRDLRHTALPGCVHARGQGFAALIEHPREFRHQAGQGGDSRADQSRRDPAFVEDDTAIGGDFRYACQTDAQVSGALLGV